MPGWHDGAAHPHRATLRTREHFNGYLHIKIIPGTSERLVLEAARWADRASVNIELPSSASLERFASDKKPQAIFGSR